MFAQLGREGTEPIVFHINSIGGHSQNSVSLAQQIMKSPIPTVGMTRGEANSAAAIIFLSLKQRIMHKGDRIGLHILDVNVPLSDFNCNGLLKRSRFREALILQAVAERIILANTKISRSELTKIMNTPDGKVFEWEEALQKKLVHQVI